MKALTCCKSGLLCKTVRFAEADQARPMWVTATESERKLVRFVDLLASATRVPALLPPASASHKLALGQVCSQGSTAEDQL